MEIALTLLLLVIAAALIFEFINGFHDSANAISMVVSTKALSPRRAIIYAAVMNFFGAFCGTHVAKTIGAGIVSGDCITQLVIMCALLGAIIWNLITWWFGLPSSSSHALIGGLLGSAICHKAIEVGFGDSIIFRIPPFHFEHPALDIVHEHNLLEKVLIPMITSPVLGFFVGFLFVLLLLWIFYRMKPELLNKIFRKLQLVSSGFLAFSHGSNDAQKTMGIITLSLIAFGAMDSSNFHIPVHTGRKPAF